jgi:hypothetical protein
MGFLAWFLKVINGEYERRIRSASEVIEYGIHHHDHTSDQNNHGQHAPAQSGDAVEQEPESEDGDSEIVNVPPGTHLQHSSETPGDQKLNQ